MEDRSTINYSLTIDSAVMSAATMLTETGELDQVFWLRLHDYLEHNLHDPLLPLLNNIYHHEVVGFSVDPLEEHQVRLISLYANAYLDHRSDLGHLIATLPLPPVERKILFGVLKTMVDVIVDVCSSV